MFRMPWGVHKGEAIVDIPSDYLNWLIENCEDDEIRELAEEEYDRREDENDHFYG